ncbi:MAG: hypothetical protein IPK80_01425 [Nannocystis sp.]|nr:hypothetical protein [Nannocystis sp.]
MLIPTKHDHPDLTLLAVAGALLKPLIRKRSLTYSDARDHLERLHPQAPLMLPLAATFLHGLGLVDYGPATDSFIFRGRR